MKRLYSFVLLISLAAVSFAQTVIAFEDFQSSGTSLPTGWANISVATDGGWKVGANTALQSSYWPIPAHTTMAATNDDACNCNKMSDILKTPTYNLYGYTTVFMSVDVFFNEGSYNGIYESANVLASTDSGATWTTLMTLNGEGDWNNLMLDVSSLAGDSAVTFGFKYSDGGDWLYGWAIDNFKLYVPYDRDAMMLEAVIPNYVLTNSTVTFSPSFQNIGGQTITSIDVNWNVNGGAVNTQSLTGLSISPLATHNFTHSTAWTPAAYGIDTIRIWTSNVNGLQDQDTLNDNYYHVVSVLDTFITKKVILEEATGAWCGYCPDGAVVMTDVLQSYENAIGITLHNGDGMAFAEGNAVNSAFVSGYPNGMVDRFKFSDQNLVGISRAVWKDKVSERLDVPIPVYVSATHTYDIDTRVLTVDVTANFYADMEGDIRFNCIIVEDSLVGSGSQWDQVNYYNTTSGHPMYGLGNPIIGYVHDHVARKMLGGSWGTAGVIPNTVPKNSTYTKQYTFTFPQNYRPQHIKLVPLVQKYNADPNMREILNSEEYELNYHVGIEDTPPIFNAIEVYPNPASSFTTLSIDMHQSGDVNITIFNTLGEKVFATNDYLSAGLNERTLNLSGLSTGMYIVQVQSADRVLSTRLSVK